VIFKIKSIRNFMMSYHLIRMDLKWCYLTILKN